MRPFDYESVDSTAEAIEALAPDGGHSARLLAGGTDLITLMKAGILKPRRLVDIKRLPEMDAIEWEPRQGLRIGALATLTEIERHQTVRAHYPLLAQAIGLAATAQLRNRATLGGNLLQRPRCWYFRNRDIDCWLKGGTECPARDGENQLHAIFGESPCCAVHPSDAAPALLALDASVELVGPRGARTVPLDEFFQLPDEVRRTETVAEDAEIAVRVCMPPPAAGARMWFEKAMERRVWTFALASVATALELDGDHVSRARVVLGGVAPIPWRIRAAEELLGGRRLDERAIAEAAASATEGAMPLSNNGYKLALVQGLMKRALRACRAAEAA